MTPEGDHSAPESMISYISRTTRRGVRVGFSEWELQNLSWEEIGHLAVVRIKKHLAGVSDGKGRKPNGR